ncbi:thiaminase (transcriptional activator TenA) [Corynebacterium appendicis CIP 107643]|uniref:Aminopyrimidine aminohydrolase n=1 Tax=Corynebacterium appendicis CIP 107643 TaxID=1161099 RepID=A0A1N7IQL3_9CORY|nr:TenA family protein [Corynebacterium appendicis]WJY59973.1 Thiaminase-2 [Corynebacterium appendicis CIP 107643]SIS39271.1 thiaminase (transcriptional activator TenA) [Corynebacterium appendicis CIP 107643]
MTRFSDELRDAHREKWDAAVGHRFVQELFDGTIDDGVMAGYLVQDYRFLDSFLQLLGAAMSTADELAPRLRLSQFIGEVAGDENTYFLRSFKELGVTVEQRDNTPDTSACTGFTSLMREAAETRSYAAALGVLVVAEWLYLDWATNAPEKRPESFVHNEWIELHDYPEFHDLVEFLRSEVDRVGPDNREVVEEYFGRAVALELDFFNNSYEQPLEV